MTSSPAKLYSDRLLDVRPELLDFIAHASSGHVISSESILDSDHDLSVSSPLLLVEWELAASPPTWERLDNLKIYADAPSIVKKYLRLISPADAEALRAALP